MLFQRYIFLALIAIMAFAVGCGTGTTQSPVASDSLEAGEEVGELEEDYDDEEGEEEAYGEDEVEEQKFVDSYVVQAGDSLRRIAGRSEIYGDPELWPVIQAANKEALGYSQNVNPGVKLKIPRRLTTEEMDEAREKARQISASEKMALQGKISAPIDDEEEEVEEIDEAPEVEEKEAIVEEPVVKKKPRPVPKKKSGGVLLPILIVILGVLVGAALILLYFMKKDNQDEEE